jgi:hypothetical protein
MRAFAAFLRFSFTMVEPTKNPIPVRPTKRMNAGRRIAHSRGGKKSCRGLDASKKGWWLRQQVA